MAKKKTKPPIMRPTHSPYTSRPVALRFGLDSVSYWIPEAFLHSLNDIHCPEFDDDTIHLTEVDAKIGHVITHYLYTGAYQTLADDDAASDTLGTKNEVRKSILSFLAAKKLGLVALQRLEKAEIVRWCEKMDLIESTQAISEDYLSRLENDAVWLQDLVLHKVDAALKDSDDIFSTTDFFMGIESATLAKLLAQRIVNVYHGRVLELRAAIPAPRGESLVETEASVDTIDGAQPAPSEWHAPKSSPPAVVEEIVEVVPEASLDTWGSHGWGLGKKKKKSKKQLQAVLETAPAHTEEMEPVTVCLPEQGLEIPPLEVLPVEELPVEELPVEELPVEEPAVEELSAEVWPVEEPPVEVWPVEEPPVEAPSVEEPLIVEPPATQSPQTKETSDSWGFGWAGMSATSTKKKKKKKRGVEEAPPPAPPAPPESDTIVGSDLIESELKPVVTDSNAVDATRAPDEQFIDSCAYRQTHLSHGGWKNCEPCKLYIQTIAVQSLKA
ncbi:hypothetical protein C7974DRAFT_21493 [Boeremia exigua]|uniref:uncharacterized protein n=1 Tax=Boeremia exigua TaxID=749465 RepID=UPI001E8D561E|nr:uncharacterized protein C7974DRAFT_21493 [Boeremia exigua]KAH6644460.1 hypothetical protein C7974DRAFT_21493 [Boeremia exigua]